MANLLGITEMTSSQAEKYATFNMAVKYLAAILCGARDIVSAYPGSPVENGCYIVGSAFGSHEANDLIFYFGAAWYEMDPVEGLTLWVWDENQHYVYNGTSWLAVTGVSLVSPSLSASASVSPSSSRSPSASLSPSISASRSASASVSPSSSASPST